MVFWSCPWGCNYARLVWSFCSLLQWPAENTAPMPKDPGISWTELAVSFMLWAGRSLPSRVAGKTSNEVLEYHDPKTSLQPTKLKSVRVLAETFRLILKHIQTFSRTKIVPAYKLQGTSSLTRLGFSRYHESGVSRHPTLPNAKETYQYLQELVLTIPHNHRSITKSFPSQFPCETTHHNGQTGRKSQCQNGRSLRNIFVTIYSGKKSSTWLHTLAPIRLIITC